MSLKARFHSPRPLGLLSCLVFVFILCLLSPLAANEIAAPYVSHSRGERMNIFDSMKAKELMPTRRFLRVRVLLLDSDPD